MTKNPISSRVSIIPLNIYLMQNLGNLSRGGSVQIQFDTSENFCSYKEVFAYKTPMMKMYTHGK